MSMVMIFGICPLSLNLAGLMLAYQCLQFSLLFQLQILEVSKTLQRRVSGTKHLIFDGTRSV